MKSFLVLAPFGLFSGALQASGFSPSFHAVIARNHATRSGSSSIYLPQKTSLWMVPRYDQSSNRWSPTTPEDEVDAGYGPIGSLVRAGPLPFVQRIIKPDEYEQAVLKYMANEGVSRMEAQGNMDAYLENPNDWTYQKLQEKNGAPKRDYANANTRPEELILSGIWAVMVVVFTYFFISAQVTNYENYQIYMSTHSGS